MYTPIIRNRQSELRGFQRLSTEVKSLCRPLIDLAAPTKAADKTAATKFVASAVMRTEKALAGFETAFVDSSELDPAFRLPEDVHPLVAAAGAVESAGCAPIPVTGLHRDAAHNAAVSAIRASSGLDSICIRLDPTDISTITLTHRKIMSLISTLGVSSTSVHLLLDLQSVFGSDLTHLVNQVKRFVGHAAPFGWASIIIGGYGLPDQINQAASVNDEAYVPRLELEVYQAVQSALPAVELQFADYTTVAPTHVELDWRIIQRVSCPKAIYALGDHWFVTRGAPFSRHPDGFDQYYKLAADVVALDEFMGPDYSFGDKYISDCASRSSSSGNQGSWISACVNHHVTLTALGLAV